MATPIADPFALTAEELRPLLTGDTPFLPELEAARRDPAALRDAPQGRAVLARTEPLLATLGTIPQTTYTDYRLFRRTGDRKGYQTPFYLKRTKLAAAALRLFFGQAELKDAVQDLIWSICEESNWVVPAHEDRMIDLFASETGFVLAETLLLLGDGLDAEIRSRVRAEVERRIFDPYLRFHKSHNWYNGRNNWNGVCNSSVAATFLLLEPEPGRAARGLELALASLRTFLATAFEKDGSSTEGVAYWHYGLMNFVALAEMLRARSGGAIDLLDSPHLRAIAAYPAKMLLSPPWFASFSDCPETVGFNPGMVMRLAERTGDDSLPDVLARPAEPEGDWRLTMMLRNILWWDGRQREGVRVGDATLPAGGVARITGRTGDGMPFVAAIKAGHNGENHNQNDIGSFVLHLAGENLLTDPGRGLYNRFYFGPQRYENIFANSYGHSVPRVGGRLQGTGHEFKGRLVGVEGADGGTGQKSATVEFAGAYPAPSLAGATRRLVVGDGGSSAGTVWLRDRFTFSGEPEEIEEAFITWLEAEVDGDGATLRGERGQLRLTIEQPAGAAFELERLDEQSRANDKPGVLKRLRVVLPPAAEQEISVRMEILPA